MAHSSDPRPSRNFWALITLLGILGGIYWFIYRKTDDLLPQLVGVAASMVGPGGFAMNSPWR